MTRPGNQPQLISADYERERENRIDDLLSNKVKNLELESLYICNMSDGDAKDALHDQYDAAAKALLSNPIETEAMMRMMDAFIGIYDIPDVPTDEPWQEPA